MEDRTLETRESFDLINRMIANTRNRMERNAGRPFLIWGYTTIIITAAVWCALYVTHNYRWNWLWFAIPVIGWIGMWLTTRKQPTEGRVHTYIDTVISQIWMVLGFASMMTSILAMSGLIHTTILFVILLMMSIGTAITGLVIRFTPTTIGGFTGIALAAILTLDTQWALGIFILGFIVTMIVPGHILNYRSNHQKAE